MTTDQASQDSTATDAQAPRDFAEGEEQHRPGAPRDFAEGEEQHRPGAPRDFAEGEEQHRPGAAARLRRGSGAQGSRRGVTGSAAEAPAKPLGAEELRHVDADSHC